MDLASAAVTSLIATQRNEQQPSWAAREPALVYVTDRTGDVEIWLHKPGQPDRPLVTAADFPSNTTDAFTGAILAPDATRVIFMRSELAGPGRSWISALTGGSPVRLVKGSAERERPGSWSPDGNWFVYRHTEDGRDSLNKVKRRGKPSRKFDGRHQAAGALWLPVWSPTGDWILYPEAGAAKLISPDGKTTRDVPRRARLPTRFRATAKTIYGIRQVAADRLEFLENVTEGTEVRKRSGPSDESIFQ